MGWKQGAAQAKAARGVGTLLMALAVAVIGMTMYMPAHAQIASTRHNLGASGTGINKFSGTTEICVFCHTPHGADTSAAVPLWNRTLPNPNTFTTYDSLGTSTLDGKVAPVGSVSIACLSCHDGVTSMSAVINQPGSGLVTDFNTGTWSGANQIGGVLKDGLITKIGQDLRNDHPIGIQYGGGGLSTTARTGTLRDGDFKMPANAEINGTTVWWVDTEATPNGTRQKTDMLLYTRAAVAGYVGQTDPEPFVECASCHDPHTSNTTFLRIKNDGSAVCLSCHVK
ncbi:cytochrome c3 family protein [Ramlibacter sp.]|uniref:cytochrome c3 family protein n=1 Tax=Ramlibacter sp. TaxID=1917967 RepID=UPI0026219E78|nr:cytochrome c3 family protein [Ramlibacter sp.]MDB5953698.1 Doubled domain protein [Ramlibacter sp.]